MNTLVISYLLLSVAEDELVVFDIDYNRMLSVDLLRKYILRKLIEH